MALELSPGFVGILVVSVLTAGALNGIAGFGFAVIGVRLVLGGLGIA